MVGACEGQCPFRIFPRMGHIRYFCSADRVCLSKPAPFPRLTLVLRCYFWLVCWFYSCSILIMHFGFKPPIKFPSLYFPFWFFPCWVCMCPIRSSIHHRKDQISQLFYYIIQNLLQEVVRLPTHKNVGESGKNVGGSGKNVEKRIFDAKRNFGKTVRRNVS